MSPRIELLSEEERTCVGITSGPGHEGSVWPQVLGNAELRERYDQHGTQGLDVNFMDASEFFTMLFGSDKFEHLVGELMLAAAARNGGEFTFAQIKLAAGAEADDRVGYRCIASESTSTHAFGDVQVVRTEAARHHAQSPAQAMGGRRPAGLHGNQPSSAILLLALHRCDGGCG